jgi:hypothetical protein
VQHGLVFAHLWFRDWVNSGLDIATIVRSFAATGEFFSNG